MQNLRSTHIRDEKLSFRIGEIGKHRNNKKKSEKEGPEERAGDDDKSSRSVHQIYC